MPASVQITCQRKCSSIKRQCGKINSRCGLRMYSTPCVICMTRELSTTISRLTTSWSSHNPSKPLYKKRDASKRRKKFQSLRLLTSACATLHFSGTLKSLLVTRKSSWSALSAHQTIKLQNWKTNLGSHLPLTCGPSASCSTKWRLDTSLRKSDTLSCLFWLAIYRTLKSTGTKSTLTW